MRTGIRGKSAEVLFLFLLQPREEHNAEAHKEPGEVLLTVGELAARTDCFSEI